MRLRWSGFLWFDWWKSANCCRCMYPESQRLIGRTTLKLPHALRIVGISLSYS